MSYLGICDVSYVEVLLRMRHRFRVVHTSGFGSTSYFGLSLRMIRPDLLRVILRAFALYRASRRLALHRSIDP